MIILDSVTEDDYICERCGQKFETDISTYHAYWPPYFSIMLEEESPNPYEFNRISFISAQFHKKIVPQWGVERILYLCNDCKFELNKVLQEFFSDMLEKLK